MIKSTILGTTCQQTRLTPMTHEMIPLTEERKREIINEEPDGLWIVLREEYPRSDTAPGDLLCGDPAGGEAQPEGAIRPRLRSGNAALGGASSARPRD